MNNNNNNAQCINGVDCHVTGCAYHTAGDCCCASEIKVANEKALKKAETFCSTFSPKSGCC
ncbi:MAG: DUF1540 domain-containing protein [Oscillospiraceae bacterium]